MHRTLNRDRALALTLATALAGSAFADRLTMLGMALLTGDLGSSSKDINTTGAMAGYSSKFEFGPSHAIVWRADLGSTNLGLLPGSTNAEARGINDVMTVVGESQFRPFVWTQALGMRQLKPLPGRGYGHADDINNTGTAAGAATTTNNLDPVPVLWDTNLDYHQLPLLAGGIQGEARRLNDLDAAVGWSGSLVGNRAVLWQGQTVTDLGVLPGCNSSEANGINASGKVVGSSLGPGGRRPFCWTSTGGMKALNLPLGATEAWANAVSNSGLVVGSAVYQGTVYAVCWKLGVPRYLNELAPKSKVMFVIFEASSINDHDQIAGTWIRAGIRSRGFLGKIVP